MRFLRSCFATWILASVCQAAQPGWAHWCTHLFEKMAANAEHVEVRTLDHPFLYQLEKDGRMALLFVTPPAPMPVWALPSDVMELFLEADEWVSDEFSAHEAQRHIFAFLEQEKTQPRRVSLSEELSRDSKMKLTSVIIENMKDHRNLFRQWRGYEAAADWERSALMSPDEKLAFMREHIERLTPLEAYLQVVEFEKRKVLASAEKRPMGEQLVELRRDQNREITVRSLTPPHQQWRCLERQLGQLTVKDLEVYLRSMTLRSDLTEAYYEGNQDWAHEESNRRRALGIKSFGDTPLLRMISASSMAKYHANLSQRRLYFINAQDAFGATGLLSRLGRHGFKISRLEHSP